MRSFSVARKWSLTSALLLSFAMCSCCSTVSTQRVAGACTDNNGPVIAKFCVVTPNVLWCGARPDKEDAGWLIQQGIRTIVNLELIHDDRSALSHATVEGARNYEVGYFRVRDWEPLPMLAPSVADDHVAHFLAIVSQQPAPVFVHCRCGMKRTAVMVAAYRVIIEGVSAESAMDQMWRYRGPWSKADANYIRSLSKRRDEMRQKVVEWIPKVKMDARVVCAEGTCAVSDHWGGGQQSGAHRHD
jgi:protein tyrosine phosphatase (PTP) superfamily phosphohydrolase (DUF442 family)